MRLRNPPPYFVANLGPVPLLEMHGWHVLLLWAFLALAWAVAWSAFAADAHLAGRDFFSAPAFTRSRLRHTSQFVK